MNNSDLMWRLVELLLQQDKYINQLVNDQKKDSNELNVKKQDEA